MPRAISLAATRRSLLHACRRRTLANAAVDDPPFNYHQQLAPTESVRTAHRGRQVINDPFLNKGTAFTPQERDRLGLRGLVPPRTFEIDEQERRILKRLERTEDPIDKHLLLTDLMDRNIILFYCVFMRNIRELMPIMYTPTVGKACLASHYMYNRAKGMYFTAEDQGNFLPMVHNWPEDDVQVIVVTDGSRILALGDLGSNGMNIPIGKLALYTAAGGIDPQKTLPVLLDVGTDNEALRNDPLYNGLKMPRIRGERYHAIVDELMRAFVSRWTPLVQYEDFSSDVAAPILNKYRHKMLCFNDDIQSTGTIALATLLASLRTRRLRSKQLVEERIVCVGAGSAGLGVCNAIADAMVADGVPRQQALSRFWLVDQHGLIADGRTHVISEGAVPFSRRDVGSMARLVDVVAHVQPTVILGLSGVQGLFTEDVLRTMAAGVEKPVVMPLSNPSENAECSAEQAFQWTGGRVIFASGSPFDNVPLATGGVGITNQCNNVFSFPGIGLATKCFPISRISDGMMLAAARTISQLVTDEEAHRGKLLPDVERLRDVSLQVAASIVKVANEEGLVRHGLNAEYLNDDTRLLNYLRDSMWVPEYNHIVPE